MSRLVGLCLALVFAAVHTGCTPVYDQALIGADGQPVTNEQILEIVSDSSLTEDEQRDALRELGITDDQLIEVLITSG